MRSEHTGSTARSRGVEIRRLPVSRRLAIGAERAGRHRAAMSYLMTADITVARRLMAMAPETLSLPAFITASVARAAADSPEVHAYRDWRGRMVVHRHVDVMVPVLARTEQAPHALPHLVPHVVRDADRHNVAQISAELLAAENFPTTDGIFDRVPGLTRIPGLVRAVYTVQDRSIRLRQRIGTVMVTTTGLSDTGETFSLAAPTLMPLHVVIGSVNGCPHQSGSLVEQHEILNLTLTFDHDVVDGAQVSAFAARLCSAIEHAEALLPFRLRKPLRAAEPAAKAQVVSSNGFYAQQAR
ncbi:pyruvate/2-oxoglutarate dehydrogenase complex dihydrolipoamide acyltransferase (E2) component [Catenulispora sp. GAS73]|uniref:2-oxo acid dehydrogenase subunit E2 n=1 Tax=Catenulispora sp. GAS73 TaxID=3156269 RepID=UPI00351967CC